MAFGCCYILKIAQGEKEVGHPWSKESLSTLLLISVVSCEREYKMKKKQWKKRGGWCGRNCRRLKHKYTSIIHDLTHLCLSLFFLFLIHNPSFFRTFRLSSSWIFNLSHFIAWFLTCHLQKVYLYNGRIHFFRIPSLALVVSKAAFKLHQTPNSLFSMRVWL